MAFPGSNYAPPSVYTRTLFENPFSGSLDALKIPVFIGEGNEFLVQRNLELVRGSSASIDQRRVHEDMTGRAVVSVSATGVVTLGAWDGVLTQFQVVNLPIVTGDGTGTVSNSRNDVSVTIDGLPIVVLSVVGATGLVELAQAPKINETVKVSYFFNRMDTDITDDVSDQVTPTAAFIQASSGISDVDAQDAGTETVSLHADILDPASGAVSVPANNVLNLIVDGVDVVVTIPANTAYTMAQVGNAIAAVVPGISLTATTFVNHLGKSTLQLGADQDITVLAGSANGDLGLLTNASSVRAKTFYTFQGPIVTGNNGGVTTTDPSHVTVKVNGVQIIPAFVDGATRAVTLVAAPAVGATVTIRYWFNSWQDTFDYLQNDGVTGISSVGTVPDTSDYTQDSDYILQDNKILWGTAWTVNAGIATAGAELFDETQISGTLIDNRTYLSPAVAVVTTSGGVSEASQRDFILPFTPTLGNGRDTPLGTSLFQTVSNGRIDLPVNRPDVVDAYWGYGVQDALDRGKRTVLKVEGSVISLNEDVPPGATCFATFYYNRLTDETFTLTNKLAGASGTGTYEVANRDGTAFLGASYDTASKGAALAGVTVVFPSGSELTPDLRHEGVSDSIFTGPVEETVTLTFATRAATPARWASPGSGPYWFVQNQSDRARITIDGTGVDPNMAAGGDGEAVGVDLANVTLTGGGVFAHLVSDVIDYTGEPVGGGGASVVGESYTLLTDEDLVLFIDGVQVDVTVPATLVAGVSNINDFAGCINEATSGTGAGTSVVGGSASTLILQANHHPMETVVDAYVGWNVQVGAGGALGGNDGDIHTITGYDVATRALTVSPVWAGGLSDALAVSSYRIWNPDTEGVLKGATRFNGNTLIVAGGADLLRYEFNSDATGLFTAPNVTIPPLAGGYASATDLAGVVQTAMNGAAGLPTGVTFVVTADGEGRLQVSVRMAAADTQCSLRFIENSTALARDFSYLAGWDFGSGAGEGAHIIEGEVAKFVNSGMAIPAPGTSHLFDRLVLRNRLLPGGNNNVGGSLHTEPGDVVGQMELRVGAGSGNTKAGLTNGQFGTGSGVGATISPATLVGHVGIAGGMDVATGLPEVTFFNGEGATAQNDIFNFTVDAVPVEVIFTSTAVGTATPVGPLTDATSVTGQILAALAALPAANFGAGTGVIFDEGAAAFRLKSLESGLLSLIEIGTGNANGSLGLTDGATAQRDSVSAHLLASTLNNHRHATFATYLLDFSATSGGANPSFVDGTFAAVQEDGAGNEFLYIESLSQGTGSIVTIRDAVSGAISTESWLFPGTGLNAVDLDGAVGEAGISGFFVESNKAAGSGSANDSLLNNAAGSDGVVGQTYRDRVTGLSFTILPQNFHDNPAGPWQAYPTGATASLRFEVSKTHLTESNLSVNTIPGFELKVANTLSVSAGDTATVQTFERGGNEPTVGDVYYTTYVYSKDTFETAYFTKMSAIEQTYGAISSDNPVTLAAYLASLNGAVLMGIKQAPKAEGSNFASLTTYKAAIQSLEGVQPGQVNPDIIVPLRGDSTDLYIILKNSNNVQSSIRYKSERTSIIGMSSGNDSVAAQTLAQALSSDRMRLVYPDTAIIRLTDAFNVTHDEVVDGTMLAAALAGSVVSPNVDVATPWTGKTLQGFVQLGRLLDAVEMNQAASKGVTIIEEQPPFLRVRHGLTTDMSNILRKTPTVRMIADEVQRQSRAVLANFIGVKFIPGILTQVEGRLSMMLKSLVAQQIIAAYTGVKAKTAVDDPTVAEVEAFYQPVFPLLYLVLAFHLRASL